MKTTKERFLEIVSEEKTTSLENTRMRVKNREVIREAQYIAMKVLDQLDSLGWSQRKLAEELKVSPQQVNKITKGSENLTLETLLKLQNVLNISLLASDLEKQQYLSYPDSEGMVVCSPPVSYASAKKSKVDKINLLLKELIPDTDQRNKLVALINEIKE
ncbi:helix-turn-helix protein [compost metagenome]